MADATVAFDGGEGAAQADAAVARSPAMRAALALVDKAAGAEIAVLLVGETGAGKEVAAQRVHARSRRAAGPFVAVNCGALPEALVEATLFGHERGAFTGAVAAGIGKFGAADGGTLFLDEIGELSPAAQASLLRAAQERAVDRVGAVRPTPVDVRLVAATNRDLRAEVAAGRFREDLFHRVAAFPIRIPPLRERPEDVAPLAAALLAEHAAREGRTTPPLSDAALSLLRAHPWPGNVRELSNALHRALVIADGDAISPFHLDSDADPAPGPDAAADEPERPDRRSLAQVEAEHIRRVWRQTGGRPAETARRLGVGRSTLYRKLHALGLAEPQGG